MGVPIPRTFIILLNWNRSVDLVFSRLSTDMFARKRVLRCRGSEQSQQSLVRELRELRKLNHQHLVQIIGSYTDIDYIAYLMKPVAEGTLEEFLSGPQQLRSSDKIILRRFYGCLAGAMNYLYTHKVRHRDLTARNILIDSAGEVYISDFGSAYNWASKTSSKTRHRNVPTSPDYMAPEVLKEDERGTRSDMWSLGMVFLEMTTKLLNHHLSELRRKIQSNADKTKAQPYASANMVVITNWMQILGQTSGDYDHDREPLGWVRELLHVEHEHRLMPPQLMIYIRESPSFGVFRCIKCEKDFLDEAFAYGPTAPRPDSREESRLTREEINEFFHDSSKLLSVGMSHSRADSIKKWIVDSGPFESSAAELPASTFYDDRRDVEDINANETVYAEQRLYNTYEHEFYHSPHFIQSFAEQYRGNNLQPSFLPVEPVELLGDTSWTTEGLDGPQVESKPRFKERDLRDSGFGFLEYMSNSSDDNKLIDPFEEISDRSSVEYSEGPHDQVLFDTFGILFPEDEALNADQKKVREPRESSELLFAQEEDRSESDVPWDEASDRSASEDKIMIGEDAIMVEKPLEGITGAEETGTTRRLSKPYPGLVYTLPSAESNLSSLQGDSETFETEMSSEALLQNVEVSLPIIEKQTGEQNSTEGETPPNIDVIPYKPNLPREGAVNPNIQKKKKKQKKARISEQAEYIDDSRGRTEIHDPTTAVPDIVIHPPENHKPEGSKPKGPKLSKENVKSLDGKRKTPITPQKRDALVPVDVRRLMDNTWEMASSAPTSTISEDTKSRLTKFFFMIPTDAQIENVLIDCCRKGSAGAVKAILQRTAVGTKPLKRRQYFLPLLYAVQGASARHNKCVRELLAARVDPNHKSKKTGLTPLHIAVGHPNFKGYTNLIWLLLSGRTRADPNARDRDGGPPLTRLFAGAGTAPLEPHKRGALIMLLKEGAAPGATLPGTGSTPLHLAVRLRDRVAVAALLHVGADANARDTGGTTPLQVTANQFRAGPLGADHAEVLDHLLQAGARADERAGALRRTALHWAAAAGCAQAVTRLLEAHADPTLRDGEEHDAMALAICHAEKLTATAATAAADRDGDTRRAEKLADHVEIMLGLERAANRRWRLREAQCAVETACRMTAADGRSELLEDLLRSGLSPNAKFRGETVLEFAMRQGTDGARRILEEWASKEGGTT